VKQWVVQIAYVQIKQVKKIYIYKKNTSKTKKGTLTKNEMTLTDWWNDELVPFER
jgi:hypothetical protein